MAFRTSVSLTGNLQLNLLVNKHEVLIPCRRPDLYSLQHCENCFTSIPSQRAVSTERTKLIDNDFLIFDLKVSNRLLQRYFAVPTKAMVFPPLPFHIFLSKYERNSRPISKNSFLDVGSVHNYFFYDFTRTEKICKG